LRTTCVLVACALGTQAAPAFALGETSPDAEVPSEAAPVAPSSRPTTLPSKVASSAAAAPCCTTADLLQLAHDVALAIPLEPHEKDRSKALERVFTTSLEVGDLDRARRAASQMTNWRQGTAFARLAEHFVGLGELAQARSYLHSASAIAERQEDWRRDRIRVAMARARVLLGEEEESARLEMGLEPAEMGKVDALRAARESADLYESRLQAVDSMLAIGSFELARNVADTLEALLRRFGGDPLRREELMQRVRSAQRQLHPAEQVGLLLRLSAVAQESGEPTRAATLLDEAQVLVEQGRWLPEQQIPQLARLAIARVALGDRATATSLAARATQLYDARRESIVDIFRAEALRPLADAQSAMGDADEAMRLYRQAIEDGATNPNARPRAVDLCETACAMVTRRLEADAELCQRMRQIQQALGAPW